MKRLFCLILAIMLGAAGRANAQAVTNKGASMGAFVSLRIDQAAAELQDLGLGWVRIMYHWTWLEQSPGKMVWFEFDSWVARARAHHLKVLVVAQGSPAWANGGHGPYDHQSGLNTPPLPDYDGAFSNYVAQLVRHGADAIEVWNEPNSGFWLPKPDATRWASLIALSYDAVKGVNPAIPVITGGVCPVPNGSMNSNAPDHFLQRAFETVPALARKCDGIGHHPYVFANDPKAKDPLNAPYQWNAILQTAAMQKVLASHGAGNRPFWFTEFGVPTGGPFGAVTPQESGIIYQHYFEAFDRLAGQGIKLGPMFFWTMHDSQKYQAANKMEGWEGIYATNGAPKASVAVIKARAALVDAMP